jgi:hypothetical protein
MEPGDVTVDGKLQRFLRRGVRRELGAILDILELQVDVGLDPETWPDALARFDDARALLDLIGIVDEPDQPDLVIDLGRWPRLVLRALETEHDAEVRRLQDAAADGYSLPSRDIPALGILVEDIRQKVGARPRRRRTCMFLETQVARRRNRRARGDA